MITTFFGNPDADTVLIQPVGDHDVSLLPQEAEQIRALTGGADFLLAAVKTDDWNRELSPWKAPAVFGEEAFGEGAEETLAFLEQELLPPLSGGERTFLIGGYSLAGLFALWAAYRTDLFAGAAGVSPSVWFPGFLSYTGENPLRAKAVYLSLGKKEEKTRNPVMAGVGDAIRSLYDRLQGTGAACILEWNEGNHFREPEMRMAKGFAWLIGRKGTGG